MNITDYFNRLNSESQDIFQEAINDSESFGRAHHLSTCIYEFSERIFDQNEKDMLMVVSTQLESACLSLSLGLYRQAFSSMRLAFEMGLGVVYFSIKKMEHYEWLNGRADIKWSILIDKSDGVLSRRFSNAFFPELTDFVEEFNDKAVKVYREMSEFVHGNNETWTKSGLKLKFNSDLMKQFFCSFHKVSEIILFALSCRYLRSINSRDIESMEFLPNQLSYLPPIRVLFGGPKD